MTLRHSSHYRLQLGVLGLDEFHRKPRECGVSIRERKEMSRGQRIGTRSFLTGFSHVMLSGRLVAKRNFVISVCLKRSYNV